MTLPNPSGNRAPASQELYEPFNENRQALAWSGAKGSALALWTLRREPENAPMALVTATEDA